MINKDRIREILYEGRGVYSPQYVEHYVLNHVKTFYFFCGRLCREPANVVLSSKELNDYIIAQLRDPRDEPGKYLYFNPHGWFGKAWTDWMDPSKNERNFKSEYCDVLIRIGNNPPYSYQIRPECLNDVVEIFAEFTNSS